MAAGGAVSVRVSPGLPPPPAGLWRRLRPLAGPCRWLGLWPLEEGADGLPRPIAGLRRRLPHVAAVLAHLLCQTSLGGLTIAALGGQSWVMSFERVAGGTSTSAVVITLLMANGFCCWLLVVPLMYRRRGSVSRLLRRWGRLEAGGTDGAGAADWLLPLTLVATGVTVQVLEWRATSRIVGLVPNSRPFVLLADVW